MLARKLQFFGQIFQKVLKNGIFYLCFLFSKNCQGALRKSIWSTKKIYKIFDFFFVKICPLPLQKILDPPLICILLMFKLVILGWQSSPNVRDYDDTSYNNDSGSHLWRKVCGDQHSLPVSDQTKHPHQSAHYECQRSVGVTIYVKIKFETFVFQQQLFLEKTIWHNLGIFLNWSHVTGTV